MKKILAFLALVNILLLTSCGGGLVSAATAQSPTQWTGFSQTSVIEQHGNLYVIGAEAVLDARSALGTADLPFTLTPSTLTRLQATVSYRAMASGCGPQALMVISIDGIGV